MMLTAKDMERRQRRQDALAILVLIGIVVGGAAAAVFGTIEIVTLIAEHV